MITVYQFKLDRETPSSEMMNAYREITCFGSESWDYSYFTEYFSKVCVVDTTDLEDCFHIMNRWSPEDEERVSEFGWIEGYRPDGSYYKLRDLHSLSVGDIIEREGKFFMVEPAGFCELASIDADLYSTKKVSAL
jgi:hypothetical protein